MKFDKLIIFQIRDEETEKWKDHKKCLARVNTSKLSEIYSNGAEQSPNSLVFEMRYQPFLEDLRFSSGTYRLIYRNIAFNIIQYDDFMEAHETVKITASSYGESV